jgi:hypothetical protein
LVGLRIGFAFLLIILMQSAVNCKIFLYDFLFVRLFSVEMVKSGTFPVVKALMFNGMKKFTPLRFFRNFSSSHREKRAFRGNVAVIFAKMPPKTAPPVVSRRALCGQQTDPSPRPSPPKRGEGDLTISMGYHATLCGSPCPNRTLSFPQRRNLLHAQCIKSQSPPLPKAGRGAG